MTAHVSNVQIRGWEAWRKGVGDRCDKDKLYTCMKFSKKNKTCQLKF